MLAGCTIKALRKPPNCMIYQRAKISVEDSSNVNGSTHLIVQRQPDRRWPAPKKIWRTCWSSHLAVEILSDSIRSLADAIREWYERLIRQRRYHVGPEIDREELAASRNVFTTSLKRRHPLFYRDRTSWSPSPLLPPFFELLPRFTGYAVGMGPAKCCTCTICIRNR